GCESAGEIIHQVIPARSPPASEPGIPAPHSAFRIPASRSATPRNDRGLLSGATRGRLDGDSFEASIFSPNSRREMRHDRCPFALFAIRKPAPWKSVRAMRHADRRTGMVRERPAPHGLLVEMSGLRLPV